MNRNDYNLIAAVLRTAVDENKTATAVVMDLAIAFARRGDQEPDFLPQDFIDRAIRPSKRTVETKVNAGAAVHTLVRRLKEPSSPEVALFTAILHTEFPHLKDSVGCILSSSESGQFSIGKVGAMVWIRFGKSAILDPIAAVRAAAPDAEQMARGLTTAKEIKG